MGRHRSGSRPGGDRPTAAWPVARLWREGVLGGYRRAVRSSPDPTASTSGDYLGSLVALSTAPAGRLS